MKKLKLVLWLIVLGLIALMIYQNLEVLTTQHGVVINLWIKKFHAELSIGVMLLGLLIAGLLIAYFFSLANRFKTRKTIRNLTEELTIERKKVSELESKMGAGRGQASSGQAASGASDESPAAINKTPQS